VQALSTETPDLTRIALANDPRAHKKCSLGTKLFKYLSDIYIVFESIVGTECHIWPINAPTRNSSEGV
jgi:hypothetical protein